MNIFDVNCDINYEFDVNCDINCEFDGNCEFDAIIMNSEYL